MKSLKFNLIDCDEDCERPYILLTRIIELCGYKLTSLEFVESSVDDSDIALIANYCPHLQEFRIEKGYSLKIGAVEQLLEQCKSLTSLHLMEMMEVSFDAIGQHCGDRLKSFSFGFNEDADHNQLDELSDASVIALFEQSTSLTEVNLTYTGLSDAVIVALALNCIHLRKFVLIACLEVTDVAVLAIAQSCTELEVFDVYLSFSPLSQNVLFALVNNCRNLREISIAADFELCLVTNIIQKCLHLHTVNLSMYGRAYVGDVATSEDIICIARHCNSNLRKLIVSGSKCCDLTLHSIALYCPNLYVLDLCQCVAVTVAGVIVLFQHCTKLSALYCAMLDASDDELVSAAEEHSVTLSLLDLVNNCSGVRTAEGNAKMGEWLQYERVRSPVRSSLVIGTFMRSKQNTVLEKKGSSCVVC